jgi:universal stress protein E
MNLPDRILAIVDPTAQQQPAVEKAAKLAAVSRAHLELAICDYEPAYSGEPFFDSEALRSMREAFMAERRQLLERLATPLRAGGLVVETHVHWRNPLHRGIVERVQETAPSLVVKDTHYHSPLRRSIFTNTDWNLIRACPAPLLLVKPSEWSTRPRLLAALDPGHAGDKPAALDRRILDVATLLQSMLGGELHAAHAFWPTALLAATTPVVGAPFAVGAATLEMVDTERQRLRDALASLVAQRPIAAQHLHFEEGTPVEVLPALAARLAVDIVVIGAVSRSRARELFIGSTADRVLDRLPCDVLVVHPPEAG